jgi:hypothetical protein
MSNTALQQLQSKVFLTAAKNPVSTFNVVRLYNQNSSTLNQEKDELIRKLRKKTNQKKLKENIQKLLGQINSYSVSKEDSTEKNAFSIVKSLLSNPGERRSITDKIFSGNLLDEEQVKKLAIIKNILGPDTIDKIIPREFQPKAEKTKVEQAKQEAAKSKITGKAPDGKPEEGKPDDGKEDERKPEEGKPDDEKEDDGKEDEGKPKKKRKDNEEEDENENEGEEEDVKRNKKRKDDDGDDGDDDGDDGDDDGDDGDDDGDNGDYGDNSYGNYPQQEEQEEPDEEEEDGDKKGKKKVIDFEVVANYFGIFLKFIIYFGFILLTFILILSFLSLLTVIYHVIINIIFLFINKGSSTNSLTLDYIYKNIVLCTKDNFSYDTFYVFHQTKQALLMLNICVYIIYLLIVYLITFTLMYLYVLISDKMIEDTILKGSIYDIDKSGLFLTIFVVLLVYSIAHYGMYIFIYKENVFKPYNKIKDLEKEIDTTIFDFIKMTDMNGNILQDDNFFNMLYDSAQIDNLNKYFKDSIIAKDPDNCLEQKIIIYNLYCYFREYINFDNDIKEKFKEYCTTSAEDKPLLDENKNIKMTFISMLNNSEIRMIRKYNEELNYFNEIPENMTDYFNDLNKSISNKINKINITTITYPKTFMPFLTAVIYIILILILNLIFFYVVINLILNDKENKIANSIKYVATILNTYIYDKFIFVIINYIFGRK